MEGHRAYSTVRPGDISRWCLRIPLLLVVLPLLAEAGERRPEFEKLSVPQGLPDPRVDDIVEDTRGGAEAL
jgi:hypothetical protein